MKLNEMSYRKWMVVIAATMLAVAVIRLWIGADPDTEKTRRECHPAGSLLW